MQSDRMERKEIMADNILEILAETARERVSED